MCEFNDFYDCKQKYVILAEMVGCYGRAPHIIMSQSLQNMNLPTVKAPFHCSDHFLLTILQVDPLFLFPLCDNIHSNLKCFVLFTIPLVSFAKLALFHKYRLSGERFLV